MNGEYFKTVFITKDSTVLPAPSFAILTASNPMDKLLGENENLLRNEQLRTLLEEEEVDFSELIGASPDWTHQEASFAVSCTLDNALKWANRFEQRAIFWVQNDHLQVIACPGNERYDLGSFYERISGKPLRDWP